MTIAVRNETNPSSGPSSVRVRAFTARPTIVIAGASGFVGRALGHALAEEYNVIGLTRGHRSRLSERSDATFHEWRSCDLYSLLDAENALQGATYAVYLVHSMLPSARLTQGSFEDMDLLCADNFARAAKSAGVKQIIYLGGLLPPPEEHLSTHLASRLEVEETLASYGTPVTTLRAAMILGRRGSSFMMVVRLTERLPVMLCPRWTETHTQPIALSDMVFLLRYVIGNEACYDETYDVGGPDCMSYREMLQRTAKVLGRRVKIMRVPFFSPGFSRFWVSLITGAPKELVAPLVESLRHPMLVRDQRLHTLANSPHISFEAALQQALGTKEAPRPTRLPVAYQGLPSAVATRPDVRSVQRLALPPGRDAAWVAAEYMRWLPQFFRPFLRVDVDSFQVARFRLPGVQWSLLELSFSQERSTSNRQLFYITGGLLARTGGRGRFEFREVLGRRYVLAAIHDFAPHLPWYVYVLTQAIVHLWVMRRFGKHLQASS